MIVHHEQVEEGLFVYQILRSDCIRIRSYPELEDVEGDSQPDAAGSFIDNELLAVDLIQPSGSATFLRLADQSGWVVADEKGAIYMRQIPVEVGLFSFFVDNVPAGMVVRRHPMDDSSDLLTTEAENAFRLEPMQRIYCDAVTEHPVTGVRFYRLQGGGKNAHATPGWVFDRKTAETGDDPIYYLLEANKVKTGLFCYKATSGAVVRHRPNCSELTKTDYAVLAHEMVVVDLVRESPYANGNGPFLRLADGSGWLFERKLGDLAMESVSIDAGKWVLSVLNNPVGMKLRKQPVDSQKNTFDTVYSFGDMVECDRRVINHIGVKFYRVQGTTGWLFDQRDGVPMLCVLSEDVSKNSNEIENDKVVKLPSWHPNFVRGVAATIPGTKELSYQSAGQILTFDNADSIQLKVFCASRTMCSIFEHSSKGTVKHFLRNCEIKDVCNALQMDLVESIISYDKFQNESELEKNELDDGEEKKDEEVLQEKTRVELAAQEETIRIRLLVCEAEIVAAQARRRSLLGSIQLFDNKRAKTAAWMNAETEHQRILATKAGTKATSASSKGAAPAAVAASASFGKRGDSRHVSHKVPPSNQKNAVVSKATSNSLIEKSYRSSLSSSYTSSGRSGHGESTYSEEELDEEEEEVESLSSKTSRLSVADSSSHRKMKSSHGPLSSAKRPHVCGECFRSFTGKYSRDIHCRNVHKMFCAKCDKIFPSFRDLEIHRDAMNHW